MAGREVVVTLRVVQPDEATLTFPRRVIVLTRTNPELLIGRASKRDDFLSARKDNGYFDSAVMSRHHGVLNADLEFKKVFIRDTGSLHGIFVNNHPLIHHEPRALQSGDNLQFGVGIFRASNNYKPCHLVVTFEFVEKSHTIHRQPFTITVPDETDGEFDESGNESSVLELMNNLKDHGFKPTPVDLTGDDDLDYQPPVTTSGGSHEVQASPVIDSGLSSSLSADSESSQQSSSSHPSLAESGDSQYSPAPQSPTQLLDDSSCASQSTSPTDCKNDAAAGQATSSTGDMPSCVDIGNEQDQFPTGDDQASSLPDFHWTDVQPVTFDDLSAGATLFEHPLEVIGDMAHAEPTISLWQSSGDRFLNSPLPAPDLSCTGSSPELDMTSASCYLMSKMAVGSPSRDSTRSKRSKRKACDMDNGPDEDELCPILPIDFFDVPSPVRESVALPDHVADNASDPVPSTLSALKPASRPFKKFRRMAEAVGFAALGGVALFSTLIVTAPDL